MLGIPKASHSHAVVLVQWMVSVVGPNAFFRRVMRNQEAGPTLSCQPHQTTSLSRNGPVENINIGRARLTPAQDEQILVNFASLPPHQKHYQCGRVESENVCGALVPGESFSVHRREAHGVFGNDKTVFKWQWVECGLQMNKGSVGRHLETWVFEWFMIYKPLIVMSPRVTDNRTQANVDSCATFQVVAKRSSTTATANIMRRARSVIPISSKIDISVTLVRGVQRKKPVHDPTFATSPMQLANLVAQSAFCQEDLQPETLPSQFESFSKDVVTFLNCLSEFPEFNDEAVDQSMKAFEGDLKGQANEEDRSRAVATLCVNETALQIPGDRIRPKHVQLAELGNYPGKQIYSFVGN
ncbi:hypothetical protein EDD15DRAFT_2201299 [Pisolithus albus]|nr:hypothetical protein EDD15DRAFT_2201299 [Pisolithus albus]